MADFANKNNLADELSSKMECQTKSALENAQQCVDELYDFRDHFIETCGVDQAAIKHEKTEEMMNTTLQILGNLQGDISIKAMYHMLRGKALNVLPNYNAMAQEALAKAVKLDPKLVDGWNELGQCYWKNGDIVAAKNCFEGALNQAKNKVSLRCLSMALRQLSGSPGERKQLIEDSIHKAKEAVQMDIKDGTSWLVLANANLSLFFASGQNPHYLKQCMSAYAHAEKDPVTKNDPDLYHNRAVAYKYQEEHQSSLDNFARAQALDPGWEEPIEQQKLLLNYLHDISTMTATKGRVKPKKLQGLVQSITGSDLGPYNGGSYTSPNGKVIKLTKSLFNHLKPGFNAEKVVIGKVVSTITTDSSFPFTFCIVDEVENCIGVTLFNIDPSQGFKIWDSVAIPEPYLQAVEINHKGQHIQFHNIRVDTPIVLVVNGHKQSKDKHTAFTLSTNMVW